MKDQRFWSAILFGLIAAGAVNLAVKLGLVLVYRSGFGPLAATIADYAAPLVTGFVGGYVAAGRMPERRFVVAVFPICMMWVFGMLVVLQNGPSIGVVLGMMLTLVLGVIGAVVGALARRSGLTSAST